MDNSILQRWGLNITLDGYVPELLLDKFPGNCFYIDSLPILVGVENVKKFEQTEKIMFKSMQLKMRNIITKLWLYNDVYLNSELLLKEETIMCNNKINKELQGKIAKLFINNGKSDIWEINQQSQINLILELGYKDVIDVALYFEQYQVLIVASWSCFFTYIGDLSKLDILGKIVNIEGLYLRRNQSNNIIME